MKIILTTLLISLTFLFSCQKESSKPENTVSVCKVDSLFNFMGAKITYSGDNITKVTATDGTKTLMTYNNTGQLIKVESLEINNQSNYSREIMYDNTGKIIEDVDVFFNLVDEEKDKYTYEYLNGKPWKIKSYYFNAGLNAYHYYKYLVCNWTNDNLTSISDYDTTGVLLNTTTYTYDLTKENNFRDMGNFSLIAAGPLNGNNLQTAFYVSKNILKKAQEDHFDSRNYGFEYTFNSQNNITLIKVIELTSGEVEDVQEFFYKCD